VWTRHPREPRVLDRIEGWFESAGFERHTLRVDGQAVETDGEAVLLVDPTPFTPGQPLFTFLH
jgi:hypothetical protein